MAMSTVAIHLFGDVPSSPLVGVLQVSLLQIPPPHIHRHTHLLQFFIHCHTFVLEIIFPTVLVNAWRLFHLKVVDFGK